jgi:uncharacterized protein (DUF2141 family)
MMTKLLPLLAFAALPAAAPAPTATLTIEVTGLHNAKGRVHVDLCDERRFLGDNCPISLAVPARAPVTVLVLHDVPPGRYAAQLFHDENMNDKADRGLFGLPKEGLAFSRDATIKLAPPRWADAVVEVKPGAQTIRVRMRYGLGALSL